MEGSHTKNKRIIIRFFLILLTCNSSYTLLELHSDLNNEDIERSIKQFSNLNVVEFCKQISHLFNDKTRLEDIWNPIDSGEF